MRRTKKEKGGIAVAPTKATVNVDIRKEPASAETHLTANRMQRQRAAGGEALCQRA